MEIRPVRTEEDYEAAIAEVERLFDSEPGTVDFDRLEVRAILVEDYEQKHYPIGPPHPIAAIEYEMEKRGLTRRDLEPILGSSGRVSEVLNRQRRLSMTQIRRLHEQFGISADILLADYELSPSPRKRQSVRTANPARELVAA
jgi:HTH-type transcriptional regulator/antitoxin HigA